MRSKAEQFLGRTAHRLKVDHLDAEQRHAGAETQHVAVARHLRRVVVDVEQSAAAAGAQDDLLRMVDDERAVMIIHAPGADDAAIPFDEIDDGRDRMFLDACVGAQLLRQHLGDHVAGGVVVMAGPVSGVTGKRLEIELAVRAADEIRAPGFEIVHHINNVVDPHTRKLGIDEFAAVT